MAATFAGGPELADLPPDPASTERFLVQRISKLWTFRIGSIDNEQ